MLKTVFLTVAVSSLLFAGCSSDSGSDTNPDAQPAQPTHVWPLDGDLDATVGEDVGFATEGNVSQEGGALALDGGSGAAVSRQAGPVDTTHSFTVMSWVALRPFEGFGVPPYAAAAGQIGEVANAFSLGVAEGDWAFTMKDADTNDPGHSIRASGRDASRDAPRWVHLAGVYDSDAGEIRLYVDGALAATTPFSAPWRGTGPLTIGRGQAYGSPGDYWPGAIADVRLYDVALDNAAVAAASDAHPTTPPPPAPVVPEQVRALNGDFVYDMTKAESRKLEELFGPEAKAAGFPGRASVVQRFEDGQWWQYYKVDGVPYLVDGNPEGNRGVATVNGDVLSLDNALGAAEYHWKLDKGILTLKLANPVGDPVVGFVMEHTYNQVG